MNKRTYVNTNTNDYCNRTYKSKSPPIQNKSGFHVRNMNSRTFFTAKDNDFDSDIFNAKNFILAYISEAQLKEMKKDIEIHFYFNEDNLTFYIGDEAFMKVNNKQYGLFVIQSVLSTISNKKCINYSFKPKNNTVCIVTCKSIYSKFGH